jgi:uncharacterized protein YqiB (DUF1249 family)
MTLKQLEVCNSIYQKLQQIIPDLEQRMGTGAAHGTSQIAPAKPMTLSLDYLRADGDDHIVSLAYGFDVDGDIIPDPSMDIRISCRAMTAQALTFQNQYVYQRVHDEVDGEPFVNLRLRSDLNAFLDQWLSSCIEQGHQISFSAGDRVSDVHRFGQNGISNRGENEALTR